MSTSKKILVVNGDDFGLSRGVNRGFFRASEKGILRSASLLVRRPDARQAAAYCHRNPQLGVGLHLDLGEWIYRAGSWVLLYEVVRPTDVAGVRAELSRQLKVFRDLMGREPTHVDSHQHAHRKEPVREIVMEEANRIGIPVRDLTPGVRSIGNFYGQSGKGDPRPAAIQPESLIETIQCLTPGVSELCCHPGEDGDFQSIYSSERQIEVDSLCDTRVIQAVAAEGVELRSFAGWNPWQ